MKKLLIFFFLFITLFSFSLIVSAEAFPNSAVNLLNPASFSPNALISGVKINKFGDYYVLNGTATANIKFNICSFNFSTVPEADDLFIIYGGTDNSAVSVGVLGSNAYELRSSSLPLITAFPKSKMFVAFIFIPLGSQLSNVIVRPVVAPFNYSVYDYGTDISNQTDFYYNEGFTQGKLEGESEGYELGVDAGYSDGYKDGKGEGYDIGANNGEMVGYIDGYKNGYTNYKISTEYANALKSEYSSGFKEGAASVEAEKQDNALTVLIPMLIIDGVLCLSLIFFKSRRRRKNK